MTSRAPMPQAPVGVFTDYDDAPIFHFATIGRRSGARREKFWGVFAAWGDTIYCLEERAAAHWVANVRADPRVEVWRRPGARVLAVRARVVDDPDEEAFARALVEDRLRSEWDASQT